MTTRARDPVRTRKALLDAGLHLAGEVGLAGTSVNRVVAEAGVAKGSFFWHFGRREDFLIELHRHFHERLTAEIAREASGLDPGRERLLRGIRTYLDGCLRESAVKAFLLEARSERHMAEEVRRRNAQMAEIVAVELRAMGWPDPAATARLVVGMAAEAALVELEAGARQPAIRKALERLLGSAPDGEGEAGR